MMQGMGEKTRVLYLSYTGLMEPLGQSQVLAYLKLLSECCSITLVTFEKAEDLARTAEREALRKTCAEFGIDWVPRQYHQTPRIPATAWDLTVLLLDIGRCTLGGKTDLVHCRSYIPAMAACVAKKLTRVPFVFDMRALWPEEMVTAGTLREGGLTYRVLQRIEKHLMNDADVVVSLTRAAVEHLRTKYPAVERERYVVIPTCVELERFRMREDVPRPLTIGSVGTVVSGWYELDWLFRLYQEARKAVPDARIKIVTRDDPTRVRAVARSNGVDPACVVLERATPQQVASKMADMSFGVTLFKRKLGSAPTRLAEFLACGIPVLANRGVGDMAEIVEEEGVGVVVDDGSAESLARGLHAMMAMLQDPNLASRCWAVAERRFSVASGAQEYRRVYGRLCALGEDPRDPS